MADVKLLAPQRLTDNANGGGLSTSVEIVDGAVNNLFDDISRIDRVNGDVSLRKAFVQAVTPNTDVHQGLHAIVSAPPADENVSVVLFRTGGWADQRTAAKSAIERYLDRSVVTRMVPYDRQLAGQRTVLVFQRPEASIPDIGEVFEIEDPLTGVSQAIRISNVLQVLELFTDALGDFQVRVMTLSITQPLEIDFVGSQPSRYFRPEEDRALIRRTVVSDAARYKGVVNLADDAETGDLLIRVESVFAQLVPAATTEIALVDLPPTGNVSLVPATHRANADGEFKRIKYAAAPFASGGALYFGTPISPGSARVTFRTTGSLATYNDAGDGTFSGVPAALGMRLDYDTGVLTALPSTPILDVTLTGHSAAAISGSSFTYNLPIEEQSRGYVYAATLQPIPALGSLKVYFSALGRWYELADLGTGVLVGEPGTGSGQINFATGTFSVTLGALPDIGSSLVISYGQAEQYRTITEDLDGFKGEIHFTVPEGNVEPGSFQFRLTPGGAVHAEDDGAGALSGSGNGAEGWINYGTGEVRLRLQQLPTPGVDCVATYDAGVTQEETFNPSKSGATVTLALEFFPVKPGSLSLVYEQEIDLAFPGPVGLVHTLRDDGEGGLIDAVGEAVPGASVNYTTGSVTFNPDFAIIAPEYNYADVEQPIPGYDPTPGAHVTPTRSRFTYQRQIAEEQELAIGFVDGTAMIARYKTAATTDDAGEYAFTVSTVAVELSPDSHMPLVPGSVSFAYDRDLDGGGDPGVIVDRAGSLYRLPAPMTPDPGGSAGTLVGTIDYATGRASLSTWPAEMDPDETIVLGGLLQLGQIPIPLVTGRAPGSPLRPASFGIRAVRVRDSAQISATADADGNLETTAINGYVDINTGVFSVAFGRWWDDDDLTLEQKAEPWYKPENVNDDGQVFQVDPVVPGTIFYNAVVQSAMPLDPVIIGINPVRLPIDGRVQILRPGDTLVIRDERVDTLEDDLEAGQVLELTRGDLADVALYDQNNLGIPASLFTVDLVAGEVTMTDPLDLSDYEQPLVARHAVEDMALCIDAEITGEIKLGQALSRDYPAASTRVSSAIVIGDVAARVENLFAQETWVGEWSDTLIGDEPTSGAQYNELAYPLVVLNRDAITMRWALVFTASDGGNIVAEEIGVVGTFETSDNLAPINPATDQPYFEMAAAGFGLGWSTGNVIRFNTIAAGAPIWAARTVRSGAATGTDDHCRLQLRWDKDA